MDESTPFLEITGKEGDPSTPLRITVPDAATRAIEVRDAETGAVVWTVSKDGVADGDADLSDLPTGDQKAALDAANSPDAGNAFATADDLFAVADYVDPESLTFEADLVASLQAAGMMGPTPGP